MIGCSEQFVGILFKHGFVNHETIVMFCSQMNQAVHLLSTSLYSLPFNQHCSTPFVPFVDMFFVHEDE